VPQSDILGTCDKVIVATEDARKSASVKEYCLLGAKRETCLMEATG